MVTRRWTCIGSRATGIRQTDFASFAAIGAVVAAVHAEANGFETLAVATVALALAIVLGFVALIADGVFRHRRLGETI